MDLFELFNVDKEEYSWMSFAACKGMTTNDFFDFYEEDPIIAAQVDEHCLSCPVIKECGMYAHTHKEPGTWGGIYWKDNGSIDAIKNKHKTAEVWSRIEKAYGRKVR